MARTLFYIILGYLSGSILYARVWTGFFSQEEALLKSKDANPGTANAFICGGPACGLLTLLCDIMKGFLPVFLYMNTSPVSPPGMGAAFVLAAPVLGHAFSLFYRFEGGKGIAVSFGCLLGLLPSWGPIVTLAAVFIFFSLIVIITPHLQRTFITYVLSAVLMLAYEGLNPASIGFMIIAATVCIRLHLSREERETLKVGLLWTH